MTPSLVSKWNTTLEEDGIEELKSTRGTRDRTPNSMSRTESNSASCSKTAHKRTGEKSISGYAIGLLPSLTENSISTTPHAIVRGFSTRWAIALSSPNKKPPKKISKQSDSSSKKRVTSSKKVDRWGYHPLYRQAALSICPCSDKRMDQRRHVSDDFASRSGLVKTSLPSARSLCDSTTMSRC